MHPKDDLLRAFHDRELSDNQTHLVREHLTRCPDCQKRLNVMAGRAERVQVRLDSLTPGPFEQPRTTQAAYRRFAHPSQLNARRKESNKPMSTRRPLWTALAVIAVLALVFTLTPARAWASDFLGLFRVEKVQVITFDPDMAEVNRDRLEANREAFERIFEEDLEVTEHGDPVEVSSLSEAADQAGFTPRVPAALEDADITVKPGMNAIFTIDQPKLQELIDAAGADVQLPEEVNGQVVTVDMPDAVVATSNCDKGERRSDDCLALIQLPSPTINAPESLNMQEIGEAMFQFLGLSDEEASRLSRQIDWTTTLVVPVPQDDEVQFSEVKVDGVTGTLFVEDNGERYMLLWIKDGMVYNLSGPGGEAEALDVVSTLQ